MVYVITALLTILISLIADYTVAYTNTGIIRKKVMWFLYCIPVIFVSMIRYNVGTDFINIYWKYFQAVSVGRTTIWDSTVEIDKGLYWFNRVLLLFTENPSAFFYASSIIIYFSIFRFIKISNERITLPTIMFLVSGLYFSSLNIVRQFLAFSIVLFSWKALKQRKWWIYMGACLLAASFHFSAIVLIVLYPIYEIKLNKRRFFLILMYVILSVPFISYIAQKIVKLTRYNYYLTSKLYIVDVDWSGVVYAILATILAIAYYDALAMEKEANIWKWTLLIYDAIVICSFFIPLANRMGIYFKFFVFVNFLPKLFHVIDNGKIKIVLIGSVLIFFLISTTYLYYFRELSNVLPYHTIWSR